MSRQNNYAGSGIRWLIRVAQLPILALAIALAGCETNKFIGAAAKGKTAMVEAMLTEGSDIDQRGMFGRTALMAAASGGHTDTVQTLLAHGVDVNARTNDGRTALMMAAGGNHCAVMRMMLDKGADVEAKNNSGWTPLMEAAYQRSVEAVQVLLEREVDVNARDNDGWTALMFAVAEKTSGTTRERERRRGAVVVFVLEDKKSTEIVEMLLSHGANPNAREKTIKWSGWGIPPSHGRSALHIAAGNIRMGSNVKALLDHGAEVNAQDGNGVTALMGVAYRSQKQDIPTVKELLAHGADVNLRNCLGHTALSLARSHGSYAGRDEIVRLLKEASAAKDK